MKLRKIGKKSLAFLIINTVLIIYIFTISIGYSFLSKSLNISGTASTYNPKLDFSPFEIVENTDFGLEEILHEAYPIRRYFFNYLDINNNVSSLTLIDSVDNDYKTYNLISSGLNLFPNDPNNEMNSAFVEGGQTLLYPLYIVFRNITSYPLDNFYVTSDTLNSSVADFPTDRLKIKLFKVSSVEEIRNFANEDVKDNRGWNGIKDEIEYSMCIDEVCNIKTDTVGIDEYLVLGLFFYETKGATAVEWEPGDGFLDFSNPIRENDGISIKFWESKFSENSAFKIRIAFVDTNSEMEVLVHVMENQNTYYAKPSSYHHPVDWWYQP